MTATAADLTTWLANRNAQFFPYQSVVQQYHSVGKHFVPQPVLKLLAEVRAGIDGSNDQLTAFLHTALDKFDDRYDYPTYLALSVLDLPSSDDSIDTVPFVRTRCERLRTQLVCDLIQFELDVLAGNTDLLPELRPTRETVDKRLHLAVRMVRPGLTNLGLASGLTASDPIELAGQIAKSVRDDMSASERHIIDSSMLPVYTAHDEYLFLRVLQSFETTFALIAAQLRGALQALARRNAARAVAYLAESETALKDAALLFSILATMQVESFRTFRNYTEGASAIQSRNYKTMESICRTPDRSRIDSLAYYSVPEVRARILAGNHTLDDAFLDAAASGSLTGEEIGSVHDAMRNLEAGILRWRQTHHGVAVRMLGEGTTGTGATEGVPYLASVRGIPVFTETSVELPRTCPFAKVS